MSPDEGPARVQKRRPFGGSGAEARIGERLIALFILGIVLFNPLMIGLFDRGIDVTAFGLPLLYAYLFAAWGLLIALLAGVIERAPELPARPPGDGPRRHDLEEADG